MKLKTLSLDLKHLRTLLENDEVTPLSDEIVNQYVEEITISQRCPKLLSCFDGNEYWLFDGYHRLEAMKKVGFNMCEIQVYKGTRRDALRRYIKDKLRCRGRQNFSVFKHCLNIIGKDIEWGCAEGQMLAQLFDRKPVFFENLKLFTTIESSHRVFAFSINKHGTINLMRRSRLNQ